MSIQHKVLSVLSSRDATSSAPSGASAGVEVQGLAIGNGNIPDHVSCLVLSSAGSGTMSCSVKLFGYVADAAIADWFPLGVGSVDANRGLLNSGDSIGESEADKIRFSEAVNYIGHFDRVYAQVTAIAGSSTAISVFLVSESVTD
jgi:hypothetical protein